ncbi:hypothetical protein C8Q79DRAFT_930893 [Trametes meyenii]|nr:hypothetical protein C8Q79DRAFT_930893 [Trametes meyenii]
MAASRPWDVYAQSLMYLGYGYPLWAPDCDSNYKQLEVEVGDVGWIRQGTFRHLLRCRAHSIEEQPHDLLPDGYVVFSPNHTVIDSNPNKIVQKLLVSKTVKVISHTSGVTSPLTPFSGGLSFTCQDTTGALLMLDPRGEETFYQSRRHIVNYLRANARKWTEFAKGTLGIQLKQEDLRFVCGVIKTSRWSVAAFSDSRRGTEGSISYDSGVGISMNTGFGLSISREPTMWYNSGPSNPRHGSTAPLTSSESTSAGASLSTTGVRHSSIDPLSNNATVTIPSPGPSSRPSAIASAACATSSEYNAEQHSFITDSIVSLGVYHSSGMTHPSLPSLLEKELDVTMSERSSQEIRGPVDRDGDPKERPGDFAQHNPSMATLALNHSTSSLTDSFGAPSTRSPSPASSDESYKTAREGDTHSTPSTLDPSEDSSQVTNAAQADSTTEKYDQCLFFHYFKTKRRLRVGRLEIIAGAGPHQLPPNGDHPAPSPAVLVDDGSRPDALQETDSGASTSPYDPVNFLLDYILQNSEAEVAIASTMDLYALFKDQEFPEDVCSALIALRPAVDADAHGVGTFVVGAEPESPGDHTSSEATVSSLSDKPGPTSVVESRTDERRSFWEGMERRGDNAEETPRLRLRTIQRPQGRIAPRHHSRLAKRIADAHRVSVKRQALPIKRVHPV